ncbi:tricin synthase 1-like [Dorcoceras hygrometricum]|uniref:Tricin synthase 1-like n=1 Tax=Dorcoceras hygrometricum TaxID=472368 RepID=A0A2Z7BQ56_9LAMI|nr:tricin synthase 1-like [Dorcoceras hygrometricum]
MFLVSCDDLFICLHVSPDEAQLLAMLVQILGAERCIEVGVYTILRELREETATMRGSQMQVSPDEAQLLAMLVQILGVERCIEVGVYTVCMCGIILSFSLITDGRRRHKKPRYGTDKKSSSAPRQPRTGIIWTETDEYFRELTIEDIERLEEVSAGFSGNEKCFMIPCLDNDDSVCRQYDALNGLLMQFRENDDLNIANVNVG